MRHTRLSLVLIALALVVAACTSDSDDTTTTTTTTEPTTTETTTEESTTTTTEAATETTTESETPQPLPELNPPPADNALSVEVLSDWSAFRGIDRCEWTPTRNPEQWDDLWAECKDAAADHFNATANEIEDNNATIVESFGGTEASVIVREPVTRADHLCIIDANEIVTTATEVDVESVLWDALGVKQNDVSPSSESGELPVGLLAFKIEGADPVDATSALVAAGIPASPRYALMPSPAWAFGPGGPALPADPGVFAEYETVTVLEEDATAIPITVIDTRSATTEPPELADLSPALVGHGQFIAGIITRLLPNNVAYVFERSALKANGSGSPVATEAKIVSEIDEAIADELSRGGIINVSFGTYTCRSDHLPLQLAAKLGEMVQAELIAAGRVEAGSVEAGSAEAGPSIAVVAAAGNDSFESGGPVFWPAGFSDPALIEAVLGEDLAILDSYPTLKGAISALHSATNVIGVGALVHNGDEGGWLPAEFSNQVAATVWAPGANIVSNHPLWEGLAQWDGTSFAAPHVAAVIANCVDPGAPDSYRNALTQVTQSGNCSR